MSENWIDDLPMGFVSAYLALIMKLSNLPGHMVPSKYDCLQYFEAMGTKIQQENGKRPARKRKTMSRPQKAGRKCSSPNET